MSSYGVKQWRKRTKEKIVNLLGGKCYICGYNKCFSALQFHHLNPSQKQFSFGKMFAHPVSFCKIVQQLKKCICVCSNCHKQIHSGLHEDLKLQNNINQKLLQLYMQKTKQQQYDICPVCGRKKKKINQYCSLNCAAKVSGKVKWDQIDLKDLLQNKCLSYKKIGALLGCSDIAVAKRAKKLNLKSSYSLS